MSNLKRQIPNMLSAYRIAAVPVLTVFFYIGGETATWINIGIFSLACISDYLDGVIARRNGYTSTFGQFLDATSDKILIGSVLLLLIAFEQIDGYWVIPALIIFAREIMVSGLREFLGQHNISVPVSWIGKSKTAVQMIASGFLMAGDYGAQFIPHSVEIGYIALIAATLMTVISGADYLIVGIQTIKKIEDN